MKGQQPERGRSQGRGVRHERNAAKRASILDGGPSGGYKRQHRLQRGAPLYCVDSTCGDVQLIRTLPRHAEAVSCLSLQFLFQLFYAQYQGLLFFESLPRHHVVQDNHWRWKPLHPSKETWCEFSVRLIFVGRESAHDGGRANLPSHGLPERRPPGNLPVTEQG